MSQTSESIEQIRRQFDFGPYPKIPLEKTPKNDKTFNNLFLHHLATPYYLKHQKVISPENKVILDAGCGSGYKALSLAEANPNAKIVGIDLSPKSVDLAKKRLEYHGFPNAEFYTLAIEEVGSLGLQFDYINCDEVLYLTDDPVVALKAMKATLTSEGIIRTNLHSLYNRGPIYRMQELFRRMGLTDDNPEDMEIEAVVETMRALKKNVQAKAASWDPKLYEGENQKGTVLSNYLLLRDKGYTIPQVFDFLRQSDLEFISMVDWRQWELLDLFQKPDDLPWFLEMGISNLSVEERLHFFELLHPTHRLFDFWCTNSNLETAEKPVNAWEKEDWEKATVYLHPLLVKETVKTKLLESVSEQKPFEISQFITLPTAKPITIESNVAACLLPLFSSSLSFVELVNYWLKVQPVNPATLEPKTWENAFSQMQKHAEKLEAFTYLLLEIK